MTIAAIIAAYLSAAPARTDVGEKAKLACCMDRLRECRDWVDTAAAVVWRDRPPQSICPEDIRLRLECLRCKRLGCVPSARAARFARETD